MTIQIRNGAGKLVKTLKIGRKAVNVIQRARFTVPRTWRASRYRFYVKAIDAAGHVQRKIGSNRLTVT